MPPLTEADTCRKYVVPKLYRAGWDDDRISEQRTFTDGRIVVGGGRPRRRKPKRADYLLQHRPDSVAYLDGLQAKVDNLKNLQEDTAKELDALLPSILSKAFAGEL